MAKQASERGRFFGMVLYPENPLHQDILNYLLTSGKTAPNPFRVLGVMHDQDKKEDGTPKKDHIHIMLEYARVVTASGVAKSFGGRHQVLRLYEVAEHAEQSVTVKRPKISKNAYADHVSRFYALKDSKLRPVILVDDEGNSSTVDKPVPDWFDVDNWSGLAQEQFYTMPEYQCAPNQCWQLVTVQTIEHVECIHDPIGYAYYLTHGDYASVQAKKHYYDPSLFFGDDDFKSEMFQARTNAYYWDVVFQAIDNFDRIRDFMQYIVAKASEELMAFVRKSYSIIRDMFHEKQFGFGEKKKKAPSEPTLEDKYSQELDMLRAIALKRRITKAECHYFIKTFAMLERNGIDLSGIDYRAFLRKKSQCMRNSGIIHTNGVDVNIGKKILEDIGFDNKRILDFARTIYQYTPNYPGKEDDFRTCYGIN